MVISGMACLSAVYRLRVSHQPTASASISPAATRPCVSTCQAARLRANIHRMMDEIGARSASVSDGRTRAQLRLAAAVSDSITAGKRVPRSRCAQGQRAARHIGCGQPLRRSLHRRVRSVRVGVHFGSRGLGHGIATWILKAAGAKDGMMVDPVFLDINSDLGAQYDHRDATRWGLRLRRS